jgi:hypothetical protein
VWRFLRAEGLHVFSWFRNEIERRLTPVIEDNLFEEDLDRRARVAQGVMTTRLHSVVTTKMLLSPSRSELSTGFYREIVIDDVDDT